MSTHKEGIASPQSGLAMTREVEASLANSLMAQVITLPRREDRRAQFSEHAAEQGINFWWRPGVAAKVPAEGISEAHRTIVRFARRCTWPCVLIMEDDAWFPGRDGFRHFVRNIPAEYDIYLGGIYGGNPDAHGRLTWWSGMHCYLVHARFYDTFLSVDPAEHIDYALRDKGDYHVCQPYACMQRDGFSDNTGKVEGYSQWAKDKVYR